MILRLRPLYIVAILASAAMIMTFVAPPETGRAELAEALVRHQLGVAGSYLAANYGNAPPGFVSFVVTGGLHDLPAESLQHISDPEHVFLAGSSWKPGRGMFIGVGVPKRVGLRFYIVRHWYICGSLCGSQNVALAFYGLREWHIVESVQVGQI